MREYIYISAWGIIYAKQNNDLGNMNTAAILSQAEKLHQQGDLQQAELNYQAALAQAKSQQEPSNIASALFGIATLYNQTKRFDLAIQSFSEALLLEPEAFDINFNALVCLVNA
ncbi:MAG: tetratricopeptide repeat protein, partial [Glaciecola sp.]